MNLGKVISIRKVLQSHSNEKIPSMIAYKIMKFIKETDTEQELYDKKIGEIIEEYALRENDGKIKRNNENGGIQIIPSKVDDCGQAIKDLQSTNIDCPKLKLTIEDLSIFQMSVNELSILDDLLENNTIKNDNKGD